MASWSDTKQVLKGKKKPTHGINGTVEWLARRSPADLLLCFSCYSSAERKKSWTHT